MSGGRFIQAVVDVDDTPAATGDGFAHLREIPYGVRAAHAGLGRAVAEHDHEVGCAFRFGKRTRVDGIVRAEFRCGFAERCVIALFVKVRAAAVHERHDGLQHVGRIVVALVGVAAEQAQKALPALPSGAAVHARGVVHVDGLVAVLFDSVLQLVGDGLDGLVPADFLELPFASLARALHGVHEAVGAVDPAAHGASAQAGAALQVAITQVVRFHIENLAVFRVPLEDAVAAAVDVALAPMDLVGGGGSALPAFLPRFFRCAAVKCACAGAGKCQSGKRSFDEGAA